MRWCVKNKIKKIEQWSIHLCCVYLSFALFCSNFALIISLTCAFPPYLHRPIVPLDALSSITPTSPSPHATHQSTNLDSLAFVQILHFSSFIPLCVRFHCYQNKLKKKRNKKKQQIRYTERDAYVTTRNANTLTSRWAKWAGLEELGGKSLDKSGF